MVKTFKRDESFSQQKSKYTFTVTKEESQIPLKQLIKKKFSFSSRLMTKIKFQNLLFVNGIAVPGWHKASIGDVVSVSLPKEKSDFPEENIPIDMLFEDDDLLIVNKQPYVTVHPTRGHPTGTIANGLMKYMNDKGSSFKIRFVNRLDMDTSGILIIGKNSHAQAELVKQMQAGKTEKRYIAVISGIPESDEFMIDMPIGRPSPDSISRAVIPIERGGYPSKTKVKVIKKFKDYSLVELRLLTGRTHQIRVHLSSICHPIVGDSLYGGDTTVFPERQALHAVFFACEHPVTKKRLIVEAPISKDIQDLIVKLT